MARLRIFEDETWPDLRVTILVTTSEINEHEDDLIQVPVEIADLYFRAKTAMREAEDSLLGWLWNNKHGDAQRVIPNVLENWRKEKDERR